MKKGRIFSKFGPDGSRDNADHAERGFVGRPSEDLGPSSPVGAAILSRYEKSEGRSRRGERSRERSRGLQIEENYGLALCGNLESKLSGPCHGMMIARRGQKTALCPRCGKRRRLHGRTVLAQSDSKRDLVGEMKRIRRGVEGV